MKIVKTVENFKYQFPTFLLAAMLMWVNNQIWFTYRAEIRNIIFDHPPLVVGWVLINSFVLFMVALHFNNLIYALTMRKPQLFGICVFVLYGIIREWIFPLNSVLPTMAVITLFLAYGIKQASLFFYMQNRKEIPFGFTMVKSDTPPAIADVDVIDPILEEVANYMIQKGGCYISAIQRNFEVGYNRAQRIMTQLERAEIVSVPEEDQPRTLLVTSEDEVRECISKLETKLNVE